MKNEKSTSTIRPFRDRFFLPEIRSSLIWFFGAATIYFGMVASERLSVCALHPDSHDKIGTWWGRHQRLSFGSRGKKGNSVEI